MRKSLWALLCSLGVIAVCVAVLGQATPDAITIKQKNGAPAKTRTRKAPPRKGTTATDSWDNPGGASNTGKQNNGGKSGHGKTFKDGWDNPGGSSGGSSGGGKHAGNNSGKGKKGGFTDDWPGSKAAGQNRHHHNPPDDWSAQQAHKASTSPKVQPKGADSSSPPK